MNILVAGGGIAGSAAALFLGRLGHDVRVLERAPSFQKRGYALSLKGFGLRLMKELGLEEEMRRHALSFDRLSVYAADGRPLQVLTEDVVTQVTDGQVFLRRSELHAVLHEASSAIAPTRFGAHVARVSEDASGAVATLSDGTIERCDLLVLAEGMRSSTRALLWGTEGPVPLGVVYAAASVEAEHGLDERAVHGYFGEGHNVAFVPEGAKRLLIQAYWRDTGVDRPDPANARAAVLAAFQSFGPKVRGLLEKIPVGGDVFCDAVSRIVLPSRVRGRVVLLGDAGYCPTFLSGMGASLGLLGAKVLSLRLPLAPSSRSEVDAALQQYDRAMAPIVAHFQETALANVGTALPSTHLKALLLGWAMHLAPMPLLTRHLRKRFEVEDRLLAGIV